MAKFSVGDVAWHASCRWEQIKIRCPTCFGKKEVTLILGNGDHIILPCGGCAPGYSDPSGYIHEYDYVVEPSPVTITGMNIEINGGVEKVQYRRGSHAFDDADMFSTEDEARASSEEKRKALVCEQQTRTEHMKNNVRKSFSWNAHYHMTEAKRHRKAATSHDEKAQLCKERGKGRGGVRR